MRDHLYLNHGFNSKDQHKYLTFNDNRKISIQVTLSQQKQHVKEGTRDRNVLK